MTDSKRFILDTNVLLLDPTAPERFQPHDVLIPIFVISELDNFKSERSARGKQARAALRYLNKCRATGSLQEGAPLPGGGTLRVVIPGSLPENTILSKREFDDQILHTAVGIPDAVLVTMDTALRIRADAAGLVAEDFKSTKLQQEVDELFSGVKEFSLPQSDIDQIFGGGLVAEELDVDLVPHQFVKVFAMDGPGRAVGYVGPDNLIIPVRRSEKVYGLKPRNAEQQFALDLLMNTDLPLVTLVGRSGSGKSILTLAAGIQQVKDGVYDRVMVCREAAPVGNDLGMLPGSLEEKLAPWMGAIADNAEVLYRFNGKQSQYEPIEDLQEAGILEVTSINHIRGRSLSRVFVILEEFQNSTVHVAKTILTRAGEGCKMVMVGDPAQIDVPHLDELSNGLVKVVEAFRESELAGHLTLTECIRSPLSDEASERL